MNEFWSNFEDKIETLSSEQIYNADAELSPNKDIIISIS
jgi:hypothetical protein